MQAASIALSNIEQCYNSYVDNFSLLAIWMVAFGQLLTSSVVTLYNCGTGNVGRHLTRTFLEREERCCGKLRSDML